MNIANFLDNIVSSFKDKFPMVRLRYAFSHSNQLHVFEVADAQLWQNDVFNQLYIDTCNAYEKENFEGDICFMYPLDFELFGKWETLYQPISTLPLSNISVAFDPNFTNYHSSSSITLAA